MSKLHNYIDNPEADNENFIRDIERQIIEKESDSLFDHINLDPDYF